MNMSLPGRKRMEEPFVAKDSHRDTGIEHVGESAHNLL